MTTPTTLTPGSAAGPDGSAPLAWQILPHLVVRHAGFPFEWLDRLAAPAAFELAGRLVAAREELDAEIRRLLDTRFPQTVTAARESGRDDTLRALSRIRRRLARRNLRPADVEAAAAAGVTDDLCAELAAVCDTARDLAELEAEFERALEAGEAGADAALLQIARDPDFGEAIFLSSPDLYRNSLRRYIERGTASQTFRRRLWAYLQRFCAKNDTASFFGPLSYAEITGDEPLAIETVQGKYDSREVFIGFWVGKRLAELIAAEPSVQPHLAPRLNALCSFDGEVVTFASLGRGVRLDATQQALLRAADGSRSVLEIAAACGLDSALAGSEVQRLVRARILHCAIEVPSTAFHPFDHLRDWLRALPPECAVGERWLGELDGLEALRVAFRDGSLDERDPLMGEMERRFTELTGDPPRRGAGQTYADRTLLYEECRGPNVRFDIGVEFFGELQHRLEPVLDLCAAHGALLQQTYRRLGRESFDALSPDGAPVAYARFVHETQRRQGAGALAVEGGGLTQLREGLDALVRERSDGRVARITRDDLARLLDVAPANTGSHLSPDVMLSARDGAALRRGEYQVVLGEVHQVIYVWGSQLYFHPDRERVERDCRERVQRVPGYEGLATVLSERQHKGLLFESFPGTMIEVAAPASERARRRLPIAALEVALDGERLVLREAGGGEELVLYTAGDDQVHLWALAVPRAMPVAVRLGEHTPRIELDGTIYQRERWQLATAEWGEQPGDLPVGELALRTEVVRRRHGLPRRVFVHVPSEPKPFYMDFASPLALRQLRQLLSVDERITLTEMEPGPDGVWLEQPGGPACCEFRMTAFRS
jgi:hypothetical protein